MATFSALFTYVQRTFGWTEKLYFQGDETRLDSYFNKCIALVNKRIKLSGVETQAQYVRVSNEAVAGDSLLFAFNQDQVKGTTGKTSDYPTTCALLQCADVNRQFRKLIFLRGIWDSVVDEAGIYKPTTAFTALLDSYIGELKQQGWGWMAAVRPTPKTKITSITQTAAGQVSFVLDAAAFDAGQIDKSVLVRVSGVDKPKSINGPLVVVPDTATTAKSLRAIGILPYTFGGKMAVPTLSFHAIDFANVTKIAEHRTGRPILQPRGRQRVRQRG